MLMCKLCSPRQVYTATHIRRLHLLKGWLLMQVLGISSSSPASALVCHLAMAMLTRLLLGRLPAVMLHWAALLPPSRQALHLVSLTVSHVD